MKKTFRISYGDQELTDAHATRRCILEAGMRLYPHLTLRAIGRECDPALAHGTLIYHFKNFELLVLDIKRYALHMENMPIILQLLDSNDPVTHDLKPEERERYRQIK
jgi:AcrR family transcriptional regulator